MSFESDYLSPYAAPPVAPQQYTAGGLSQSTTLIIVCICAAVIILVVVLLFLFYKRRKEPPTVPTPTPQQAAHMQYNQSQPPPYAPQAQYVQNPPAAKRVTLQPNGQSVPNTQLPPSDPEINSEYDYEDAVEASAHKSKYIPEVDPPIISSRYDGVNKLIDGGSAEQYGDDAELFVLSDGATDGDKLLEKNPDVIDLRHQVSISSRLNKKVIELGDPRYDALKYSTIPVSTLLTILEDCDNEDIINWSKTQRVTAAIEKYRKSMS